jgi:hypothetical protein
VNGLCGIHFVHSSLDHEPFRKCHGSKSTPTNGRG